MLPDLDLHCSLLDSLFLTKMQAVQILIRQHGWAGWSGSTLVAYIWRKGLTGKSHCLARWVITHHVHRQGRLGLVFIHLLFLKPFQPIRCLRFESGCISVDSDQLANSCCLIWICTGRILVRNNLMNQKANILDPDQMAQRCRPML
jgi:hypothetical protein